MNAAGSWWQYAVVALAVLASVVQVLRKAAPRMAGRLQAALAASLDRPGRAGLLRWMGHRLSPRDERGCGDGCSTCGACPSGGSAGGDGKGDGERPVRFFDRSS